MSTTTTTWQARLRRHYQKLKEQLKDKRFEARSLFQQQRLLARLHRCRVQLRHLATGVVMTGSLLFGNAALGQYMAPPFLQHGRGHANYSNLTNIQNGDFVDLDNDGDLDYATARPIGGGQTVIDYYENVGGIDSARYSLRIGAANPFDSIPDCTDVTFVDIDGDGDMDCFAGCVSYSNNYANINQGIWYIENQGDASSPNFVLQPNTNNPLVDVGSFFTNSATATISDFVDLDSDGDMDCFVSGYDYFNYADQQGKIIYYRNDGTTTNPNFTRLTGGTNPLDSYTSNIQDGRLIRMQFTDMDEDGDQDVFWAAKSGALFNNNTNRVQYYEQINGNSFITPTTTPLDSIQNYQNWNSLLLFDDQNNGFIDVITNWNSIQARWYENMDSCYACSTKEPPNFQIFNTLESTVSPNPSQGRFQFKMPITGMLQVYSSTGQLLEQQDLTVAQNINLEHLPNGWYFLYCRTEDAILQEKIQIQH